ncbi:MAG TPA: hypothetical protein VEL47_06600 [Myxococcota bacterium]|nr:hypothetical protein [Myxococcota bacterium]
MKVNINLAALWVIIASSALLSREFALREYPASRDILLESKDFSTWGELRKRAESEFKADGLLFSVSAPTGTDEWTLRADDDAEFFFPPIAAHKPIGVVVYFLPFTHFAIGKLIDPRDTNWSKYLKSLGRDFTPRDFPKLVRGYLDQEEENIRRSVPLTEDALKDYLQSHKNSYPAQKLLAQLKVWRELQKHEKTKRFPIGEVWRFVIDSDRQDKGPYAFEDEPGYIRGALNGLAYALQSYNDTGGDAVWYMNVHDVTVDGAEKQRDKVIEPLEKGYSSRLVAYGFDGLDSDEKGVRDLWEQQSFFEKRSGDRKNTYVSEGDSGRTSAIVDPVWKKIAQTNPSDQRFVQAAELFCRLRKFLTGNPSVPERLMAYLWLARELEINHFFSDANGRASNFELLSMIAKDPDLPMLMFENPNVLDVNGPEKLLVRVLQGMDNFTKNGQAREFELNNNKMRLQDEKFTDSKVEALRVQLMKFLADDPDRENWSYYHRLMNRAVDKSCIIL